MSFWDSGSRTAKGDGDRKEKVGLKMSFWDSGSTRRGSGSLVQLPPELLDPYLQPSITIDFLYQKLYQNEEFLRKKYLEEQRSTREIAALAFSVRSTVVSYLKAFNIPLRPTDEAHGLNKGQLAYGEKRVRRVLKADQTEHDNMVTMKQLRDQGYSFHKIAKALNDREVPTKNRKRWHGTTVMNILASSET